MQLTIYADAAKQLAIPKLTEFLKAQADITTIADWSTMKAGEKRAALLDALKQSKPLREQFVVFYGEATGSDADFSEWEMADLPSEGGGEEAVPPGAEGEVLAPEPEPAKAQKPKGGKKVATSGEKGTGSSPATAYHPQFVDGAFDQIVSDVAGLNAQDADKNLREMEDRLEFEHLRMGVLLAHIQTSQHYVTLGYDNMREYLAAHTGLHYRKAMFLVSNANAIKELGISSDELKGVSWSALRYVVQVMDKSNYKKWLDAARSLTHVALIEEIRKAKTEAAGALPAPSAGEDGKPKPQSKMFNLYPDQKALVDSAIEKAKAEGNVESTGAALELIASSYTGKPPSDTTVASVLPDMSTPGLIKMCTKLKADEGVDGLVRLLNALGEVWPDVDINVSLPDAEASVEGPVEGQAGAAEAAE